MNIRKKKQKHVDSIKKPSLLSSIRNTIKMLRKNLPIRDGYKDLAYVLAKCKIIKVMPNKKLTKRMCKILDKIGDRKNG